MIRNAGRLDRAIRLVVGVMLLGLYGALEAPLRYVTLIGLGLVATALSGFSPLYSLFGVSTCGKPRP
jgi:hypothetical protein